MNVRGIASFVLAFSIVFGAAGGITAEGAAVYWGKTILVKGQIGRATILKTTELWKLGSNGQLIFSRYLHPGEQYRIYSFKSIQGGLYGLGGAFYVKKNSSYVKYETPSKAKLAELQKAIEMDNPLNGARFGMSKNQVKQIIGNRASLVPSCAASDPNLVYTIKKFGSNVHVLYFFESDKLISVVYDFLPGNRSNYTSLKMDALFNQYVNQLKPYLGVNGEVYDANYKTDGFYGHQTSFSSTEYTSLLIVNNMFGYTQVQLTIEKN